MQKREMTAECSCPRNTPVAGKCRIHGEEAVSGVAAVLLVLVVGLIVITVFLLLVFNPFVPANVPSFTAAAERSGNLVYLTHSGGDPVYQQTVRFTVNNRDIPDDAVVILHNQPWPWSKGETIRISWAGPGDPDSVAIWDTRGFVASPLYTASLIPSPTPVPTAMPATPVPSVTVTTVTPTTPAATTTVTRTATPVPAVTPPSPNATVNITPGYTRAPETPGQLTARFDAIPASGVAPLTVRFNDLSEGIPATWEWDFGDGTGSQVRNPLHTYPSAGTYAATLTVKNTLGSDRTRDPVTITVTGASKARISWRPAPGIIPYAVSFRGEASDVPDNWEWEFGDGFTASGQEVLHTYLGPGTFPVTLTVTAGGSRSSVSGTVTLAAGNPPKAVFTATPASGSAPLEVRFQDTSTGNPSSWEWDFGDGSTGTGSSPAHVYTSAGSYTVTLTTANAFGRDTRMVSGAVKVS